MTADLESLSKILGVDGMMLERLEAEMGKRTGHIGIIKKVAERNTGIIGRTLDILDSENRSASHVRSVLRNTILRHEKHLMGFVEKGTGRNEFEKAAHLAKKIAKIGRGFFLKKELAKDILEKRRPDNLLNYLGVKTVGEALKKHDVTELFSALRFIESDEWMHETFDAAYGNFTAKDFEEREVEIKVLGPEWKTVSEQFVAKKHHNVSHLKEFGVIFVNPIRENIPGKFLRDFALLLHYFHEIEFYSKLFRKYSKDEDFAEKFKMLLRGDVPEIFKAESCEWLIVPRYLAENRPKRPAPLPSAREPRIVALGTGRARSHFFPRPGGPLGFEHLAQFGLGGRDIRRWRRRSGKLSTLKITRCPSFLSWKGRMKISIIISARVCGRNYLRNA